VEHFQIALNDTHPGRLVNSLKDGAAPSLGLALCSLHSKVLDLKAIQAFQEGCQWQPLLYFGLCNRMNPAAL